MLKSRLKEIYNFTKVVIPAELMNIEISQEVILDAEIQLARKYLTIEEVYDGIIQGDVVNLNLEDNISKCNENTQISVGRGFFNRVLEENLIGMKKGEIKKICTDDYSIIAKIVSVKRRIIPVATDELVKNEKIDGVNTVDKYKIYSYDKYVEDLKKYRMFEIIEGFQKEIIDKSEIELVEEDIKLIYNELKEQRCREAQEYNMNYEEYIQEIATQFVDNPTVEEGEKYLFDGCIERIKSILMGAYYAKKYEVKLDMDTYEKYIKVKADREKTTFEQQKEDMPYYAYLENKYKIFINIEIKEFCKEKVNFIIKNI